MGKNNQKNRKKKLAQKKASDKKVNVARLKKQQDFKDYTQRKAKANAKYKIFEPWVVRKVKRSLKNSIMAIYSYYIDDDALNKDQVSSDDVQEGRRMSMDAYQLYREGNKIIYPSTTEMLDNFIDGGYSDITDKELSSLGYCFRVAMPKGFKFDGIEIPSFMVLNTCDKLRHFLNHKLCEEFGDIELEYKDIGLDGELEMYVRYFNKKENGYVTARIPFRVNVENFLNDLGDDDPNQKTVFAISKIVHGLGRHAFQDPNLVVQGHPSDFTCSDEQHLTFMKPKVNLPQGGSHASPIPHDRSGHWRHLKNGKKVWVRSSHVKGQSTPQTVLQGH